jgi:hypothetical protein
MGSFFFLKNGRSKVINTYKQWIVTNAKKKITASFCGVCCTINSYAKKIRIRLKAFISV